MGKYEYRKGEREKKKYVKMGSCVITLKMNIIYFNDTLTLFRPKGEVY